VRRRAARDRTDTTEKQLPPWESDSLSSLLKDAQFNERASSLNLPDVYSLLTQIDSTFKSVAAAIANDNRDELLVPRFLLVRVRSAFLAAVRLSMGGQAFEAMLVLRAAIEQAWYGLHIARDPRPPQRSTTWLKRHNGPAAKQKCKEEFTISNVRRTHETLDPAGAKMLHKLYEITIDYGAHPNERGILASMQRKEAADTVTYQVGILNPQPLLVAVTLKTAIEIAIGVLKVAQLILPQQLKVAGLDMTIQQLIREGCRTFPPSRQA